MTWYFKVAIILAIICLVGYSYIRVFEAGKDNVYASLKDDRITILKDGKKIDDEVLSANDDDLVCLLFDCDSLPDTQSKP